jgi:hypothetical protein
MAQVERHRSGALPSSTARGRGPDRLVARASLARKARQRARHVRHGGQDRVELRRVGPVDVAPHESERRPDDADRLPSARRSGRARRGCRRRRTRCARLVRDRLARDAGDEAHLLLGLGRQDQVSFETPPAWFETMTLSDEAAMRVSAPGMTT